MPKLSSLFLKPSWQRFLQNTIPNQVNQFWKPLFSHGHQLWKPSLTWQEDWQGGTYADNEQELNLRRIKVSSLIDRLRWGYTPQGNFSTQEAYRLLYSPHQNQQDRMWVQVWLPRTWPKISSAKEKNSRGTIF